MQFTIPDTSTTLDKMMDIESEFDGATQSINRWVSVQQGRIKENRKLIENRTPQNEISVLNIFLGALLLRAISGEAGARVYDELHNRIRSVDDLNEDNYRELLKNANYRWGIDTGAKVISGVVNCVNSDLKWDWNAYVVRAEREKETNYQTDPLLRIKNIGFKLRDLALSELSPHYAAFDLHVTRVLTRLGWLNYGFPFLGNTELEMGNNPADKKNYLFLHRLLISVSEMTNGKYTPVDLDRVLWHFGRSICGARSGCETCPIANMCPTGKQRKCS